MWEQWRGQDQGELLGHAPQRGKGSEARGGPAEVDDASVEQVAGHGGMVGSEAQGVIRTGMAMVQAIAQGEPPRLPKRACSFLA